MTQEKNKFIILKLLILSSTLPFLLIINASDFKNFSDFIYSSSLIFGYIGISLLFWMQFLGHRKLTSLFFKDLPRTIKLHSFIGKYGTILIFLHPILLAYSYSEDIFKYIFTFSLASEYQIGLTFGKIVFYILLITWISSAILQSKIKFRPWKYLHYLTYLALPLSILHVPNVGGSNWKNLAIQSYWYLLIICYLALLILRIAFQFGYSKRKYKIKNLVKTASNSYHITLENIDKKPLALNHFEGQYIYLQKKNLGLEHPFSIIKNDSKILELGFKPFGKFSSWLSQAEIGSTLYVDGPYGNFLQNIEKNDDANNILIAGGIGITPFYNLIIDHPQAIAHLFNCNKDIVSTPYIKDFQKALNNKQTLFLSNEAKVPNYPFCNIITEKINLEAIKNNLPKPLSTYKFYICGPSSLNKFLKKSLLKEGVPKKNINSENFNH